MALAHAEVPIISTAAKFCVDDVIDPAETGDLVARTLPLRAPLAQSERKHPLDPW